MEYAIGGPLALGYRGIPRGTIDVDVTVFIKTDEMEEFHGGGGLALMERLPLKQV